MHKDGGLSGAQPWGEVKGDVTHLSCACVCSSHWQAGQRGRPWLCLSCCTSMFVPHICAAPPQHYFPVEISSDPRQWCKIGQS